MKKTKVKIYCKNKIKKFQNIEKILPEMINKKRLKNFIFFKDINNKIIKQIILSSYYDNK